MKDYVQIVQAQQFTGDIQELTDFVGVKNITVNGTTVLVVENAITGLGNWNVLVGDFVVKTRTGFEVYKEAAFNETFDEVLIEDEPVEGDPIAESKEASDGGGPA